MLAFNLVEHLAGHTFEPAVGPMGFNRSMTEGHQAVKTADGWACILPYTEKNIHDFFLAAGREDLADDPRFATPQLRREHNDEVDKIISAWTRQHTKHDLMELLGNAQVPGGAVLNTLELSEDPHLRKRGTFVEVEHPDRGRFVMPGWPVQMTGSKVPVVAAPKLGVDNQSVYRDLLGVDGAELERLRAEGVV
jgi:crotonobetainyl-CoA:carnitine CoA-transferase CaiB-like acyl-CoA transferase